MAEGMFPQQFQPDWARMLPELIMMVREKEGSLYPGPGTCTQIQKNMEEIGVVPTAKSGYRCPEKQGHDSRAGQRSRCFRSLSPSPPLHELWV